MGEGGQLDVGDGAKGGIGVGLLRLELKLTAGSGVGEVGILDKGEVGSGPGIGGAAFGSGKGGVGVEPVKILLKSG